MRILHLLYESTGDYFGVGGVATRAYEIYGRLKSRHDITLLCKRYPGARDREVEGLRHIFAGTESGSLTKTLLSYAFNSARFVKKHDSRFDVLIEEFSPAIPTFLHAFTEKPLILQVQGYTGSLYFRKYNLVYASVLFLLERIRPAFYDNFIFMSAETTRKVRSEMRGRIGIIPNGISPDLLQVSVEEGGYMLYLGRIDYYSKGLDLLLNAYAEFHNYFSHIKLVIAGDGKDMERFRAAVQTLPASVRRSIEFECWVSGARKTEIIRKSMFAVFPSRHETQGITVLEAMACGKALVVSDIPELSYVADSGAGVTFRSGDATSLSQAMRDMAENELRKEMGLKGRDWVKDLTWDKIAIRYEEFLSEVVAGRK